MNTHDLKQFIRPRTFVRHCALAVAAMAGWVGSASATQTINVNFANVGSEMNGTPFIDGTGSSAYQQAPAYYTGTTWNDFVQADNFLGGGSPPAITVTNLLDSDGSATTVGYTTASSDGAANLAGPGGWATHPNAKLLNCGLYRVVNSGSGNALRNRFTITGLDTAKQYHVYLACSAPLNLNNIWGIGTHPNVAPATTQTVVNSAATKAAQIWKPGDNWLVFYNVTPDASGQISVWGRNMTNAAGYSGLTLDGFQIVDATGWQNTDKSVHNFTITAGGTDYPGTVSDNGTGNAITVHMPASTQPWTALAPTFTLADSATCSPASGSTQDFSGGPVNYTVTAQDGTTKVYAVSVKTGLHYTFGTVGAIDQQGWSIVAQNSGDPKILFANTSERSYMVKAPCITTRSGTVDGAFQGDAAHTPLIARSPVFQLTGSQITFESAAGNVNASAPNFGSGSYSNGVMGVALVRVSDGERVAVVKTASQDIAPTMRSHAINTTGYANDGNLYYLETVDTYSGGWGAIEWDSFMVPGTEVSYPSVTLALSGSPLAEAAGVATVTATLAVTSAQDVTVELDFTGTAITDIDYTASATSITIPAGQLTGSITLTAIQDTEYEYPDETIVVDIASVTNGLENGSQRVTATITGDDLSDQCDILSFTWNGFTGVIDEAATPKPTVRLYVPKNTDLTTVNPVLTVSPNATVSPASEANAGFAPSNKTVTYTVTAQDSTTKDYSVTVYPALASPGEIVAVPPDLNPGDQYRVVFVTSTETYGRANAGGNTGPTSINDFNTFATNTATAVPSLAVLGTMWKAVVSVRNSNGSTVTAKSNTGTSGGAGVPIYSLRGLRVANGYSQLWSSALLSPINWTEVGTSPAPQSGGYYRVHTGMTDDGGASADWSLCYPSGGYAFAGNPTVISINTSNNSPPSWCSQFGEGDPNAYSYEQMPIYVMSDVLTVPEPLSPDCDMVAFTWNGYTGVIDEGATPNPTVMLRVPNGTVVNPLSPNPTYGVSLGATCPKPNGGTGSLDFTAPQSYVVTAADGTTTKTYTVSVSADIPIVTLGVAPGTISEDAGEATVTATLSNLSGDDVTVNLAFSGTAANGTNYTRSDTSIVIPAGELSGTITLTGVQDNVYGSDKTVVVDIATVLNGLEAASQQVAATVTDTTPQPSGLPTPAGINPATGMAWAPGDKYHLVFVTSTSTAAGNKFIATYNTFVNTAAAGSPVTGIPNIEWKAICSTDKSGDGVAARDNALVTGPVYLVDGATLVANSVSDMWDGSLASGIAVDQSRSAVTAGTQVFTGCGNSNGTPFNWGTPDPYFRSFGSHVGYTQFGLVGVTDATWISAGESPQGTAARLYALSVPLTHPGGTQTSYTTWATANGASEDPLADSNHNGVPNSVEFFMGGTAANPATLPALVNTAGTWSWTIPFDPTAAATYKFQVSDDLSAWQDMLPGDPSITILTSPSRIRLTLASPAAKKFCRLLVTTP